MYRAGLFIATLNFTPKFSDIKNMTPQTVFIAGKNSVPIEPPSGSGLMPNQNGVGSLYFITILCVHANQRKLESSDKWCKVPELKLRTFNYNLFRDQRKRS